MNETLSVLSKVACVTVFQFWAYNQALSTSLNTQIDESHTYQGDDTALRQSANLCSP